MKRRNMLRTLIAATLVCTTAVFAAESTSTKTAPAVKGNPKSKVYHKSACKYYKSKGSTAAFTSEAAAQKAGYKICKKCAKTTKKTKQVKAKDSAAK